MKSFDRYITPIALRKLSSTKYFLARYPSIPRLMRDRNDGECMCYSCRVLDKQMDHMATLGKSNRHKKDNLKHIIYMKKPLRRDTYYRLVGAKHYE